MSHRCSSKVGFCVLSLFCNAVLSVVSSFAIILQMERAGCFTFIVFFLCSRVAVCKCVRKRHNSVFCVPVSRCHGLVRSLRLWHFMVKLTLSFLICELPAVHVRIQRGGGQGVRTPPEKLQKYRVP